jgi:hypothetical protein
MKKVHTCENQTQEISYVPKHKEYQINKQESKDLNEKRIKKQTTEFIFKMFEGVNVWRCRRKRLRRATKVALCSRFHRGTYQREAKHRTVEVNYAIFLYSLTVFRGESAIWCVTEEPNSSRTYPGGISNVTL